MNLPETYHQYVSTLIDVTGVYPHAVMVLEQDGTMGVCALDLKPPQAMSEIAKLLIQNKTKELIYGFDRFCRKGQTEFFEDAIAGAYWNGEGWKPFIIEYQHDPRVVKPLNWENEFWNKSVRGELVSFMDGIFGQKS